MKKSGFIITIFLIFLLLMISGLSACTLNGNKNETVENVVSFNYPGLRLETIMIKPAKVKRSNQSAVCFGDSVTFGWNLDYKDSYPFILEEELAEDYKDCKVVNSGIGGDTIVSAYERLEKDVLRYKPDIAVIDFGLNDGMLIEYDGNNFKTNESLIYDLKGTSYICNISIEDFEDYYYRVIEKIEEEKIDIIILGTSPVTEDFPLNRDNDFRVLQKNVYIKYNESIGNIAEKSVCNYINIWKKFEDNGKIDDCLQSDGIHPNEEGLKIIANTVYDYIMENDMF